VVHPKTNGYIDDASAFNLIRGAGNSGVEANQRSGANYSRVQHADAGT